MMKILPLMLMSVIFCIPVIPQQVIAQGEDLVVADFEGLPNNLGGEAGVYGSLEANWQDAVTPFTWYYAPSTGGYAEKNVHGGKQSFRLVNALGTKPEESWGSVGIELGPVTDPNSIPKKVKSVDASNYKYLTFWLKGEKGGEHLEVIFRDASASTYEPQVKYTVADATAEWRKVAIPLDKIKEQIDLKTLVHIGFAFGNDVGNDKGAIIYVDDIVFTSAALPI
jgi:hypothetical protein